MIVSIAQGLLIPFAGTSLGSACVFFLRKTLNKQIQRALTGFAAGVMVAASIWSLLLPAIEQSESMGKLSFIPAVVGFWIGWRFSKPFTSGTVSFSPGAKAGIYPFSL